MTRRGRCAPGPAKTPLAAGESTLGLRGAQQASAAWPRMTRGEIVTRPFPDVAGHVEQAVAVGGEGADRGRSLIAVGEQVLPGELALPGVGHHPAARRELIAPCVHRPVEAAAGRVFPFRLGGQFLAGPCRVGFGVFVGHVGHRVPPAAAAVTARPGGPPPAGPRHVRPPVAVIPQVNRALGAVEDQRPWHQQRRIGVGVAGRVERALGDGQVPGGGHEAPVFGHGHRALVHPEAVHRDLVHRAFLRIEAGRAHPERAARDPFHRTKLVPCRGHRAHAPGFWRLNRDHRDRRAGPAPPRGGEPEAVRGRRKIALTQGG